AFGGPLGALAAQNGSHFLNPGLGQQAFPRLDDAQRAYLEGQPNPNLTAPQGPSVEAGGLWGAAVEGWRAATGNGTTMPNASAQDKLLHDTARSLAEQGPFDGRFEKSSLG